METYRGYVMTDEIDSNGHMNVQFYTKKFDLASGQLLARIGYDFQDDMHENTGFAYVESTIKYLKEVMEDSPIHVISEIYEVGNKVVTVKHSLIHSVKNTVHSECHMKWVLFDKQIRKSIVLPESLSIALKASIKER